MITRVRHLRLLNDQHTHFTMGTITIATRKKEDNTLDVGVSYCSPRDMFNRKTGYAKSIEGLETPIITGVKITPEVPVIYDILHKLLEIERNTTPRPKWIKKLLGACIQEY
jgi:hypothetical protein